MSPGESGFWRWRTAAMASMVGHSPPDSTELASGAPWRDKWLPKPEERRADSPFITPQCHYSQIFRKTNSTNGMKKINK